MALTVADLDKKPSLRDDCEKLDCWQFPATARKERMKLLNRKYCLLYPKREIRELKKLQPNFDHCKTLYTRCDYQLEECVNDQILKTEKAMRVLGNAMNAEVNTQKGLISNMWVQSQRYLRLTCGAPCTKLYPEVVSADAEYRARCKFQILLKSVNLSNCRLLELLGEAQNCVAELKHRIELLDTTLESVFLKGNYNLRPLSYVRGLIDDVMNYFNTTMCKLQSWSQLLNPGDAAAVEDYEGLLKSVHTFPEFVRIGAERCGCMRTKNPDCAHDYENKCKQSGVPTEEQVRLMKARECGCLHIEKISYDFLEKCRRSDKPEPFHHGPQ